MKKIFLLLATAGIFATACEGGLGNESNGGASLPKIMLAQQSIEVDFEPIEYEVAVTSPYSWEATTKNDWIVVESETGIAGEEVLIFSTKRNEEEKERKGTITLKNIDYNLIAEFYVIQKAFEPKITIEPDNLTFAVEGGSQEVGITANLEYSFSAKVNWLTIKESKNGLSITAMPNCEFEERTAKITITSEKYGVSKTISVTQKGISAESKNVILYTSSNGNIVTPHENGDFGSTIKSNTYKDGQGIMIFDGYVTAIDGAFEECTSLTSIIIPNSVTKIGGYAFYGCSSLTSITIPNSVTKIGIEAFCGCSSLTSITIPDSVTSIGQYAFYGCTGVLTVNCNIPNVSSSSNGGAFSNAKFTKVTIGNGVTSIGDEAFYGCSSLTSITIPNSVTSIGYFAFYGCTGVLTVNCNIPNASYGFTWGAFSNAKFTKVNIGNGITSIGSYAFYGCSSLTSATIPNSVTSIGDAAFCRCSSLTSATIPESVTSIGYSAFSGCNSLTSVTIPESVTSIGRSTFNDCSSLTSVTIPESVTLIGDYAFYGCSSLTSVTIPESVTEIGLGAFYDCSSLTSVYCKPITPPALFYSSNQTYYSAGSFPVNSVMKIYVPRNSLEAYMQYKNFSNDCIAKTNWYAYKSYIEPYDFK